VAQQLHIVLAGIFRVLFRAKKGSKMKKLLYVFLFFVILPLLFQCGGNGSGNASNESNLYFNPTPECGSVTFKVPSYLSASDGVLTDKVALRWDPGVVIEDVDPSSDSGMSVNVLVDSKNVIHAFYKEFTTSVESSKLMHAYKTASTCWTTEVVDDKIEKVYMVDAVVDQNDVLYVTYSAPSYGGGMKVKHASKNSSESWQIETVITRNKLSDLSLAIAENGDKHLIYVGHNSISYLYQKSGTADWLEEDFPNFYLRGGYAGLNKIIIDSGSIFIASKVAGLSLFSKHGLGPWRHEVVTTEYLGGTHPNFDLIKTPTKTYLLFSYGDHFQNNMKMAWKEVGAIGPWNIETIDNNDYGTHSNITATQTLPVVVHVSYHSKNTGVIKHAWKELYSSHWNNENISGNNSVVVSGMDMTLDSTQQIHILYYDSPELKLRHIYEPASGLGYQVYRRDVPGTGDWTELSSVTETHYLDTNVIPNHVYEYAAQLVVDSGTSEMITDSGSSAAAGLKIIDTDNKVGSWNSIEIDSSDRAHVLYYDETEKRLKHAWKTAEASAWTVHTVDNEHDVSKHSSLAIGNDQTVHAIYNNETATALMHAWASFDGSAYNWQTQTIVEKDFVGLFNSIVVGQDNKLHVSYYLGGEDSALEYAQGVLSGDSWVWTIQNTENRVEISKWTSIGISSETDQTLYILFYDQMHRRLRSATGTLGASGYEWSAKLVDRDGDKGKYTSGQGSLGRYTSLKVSQNNRIHVSYYDVENKRLKHAWKDPSESAWHLEIVDSHTKEGEFVGKFTSLAIADDGAVYVSYFVSGNEHLKLAIGAWDPSTSSYTWTTQDIDNTHGTGRSSSLAFDSAGDLHISYYNGNGELWYQKW